MAALYDPAVVYNFLNRPQRPESRLPSYFPLFPEIAGPMAGCVRPLGPETIREFRIRYRKAVNVWQRGAANGRMVAIWARLSQNLEIPPWMDTSLVIEPDIVSIYIQ